MITTEEARENVLSDIAVSGDPRIAVIGVGGAGCRIASMLYGKMSRVGVIAINTDKKALEETSADNRIYICKEVTKGLGTRGDPALGKKCAQIHESEIMSAVSSYNMAIIVAGMGGGTGTGAAPVIAELCDRVGVTVAAIDIMPFSFEEDRAVKAAEGHRSLHARCPYLVQVFNDKSLTHEGVSTMGDALSMVNMSVVKSIDNFVMDAPMIVKRRAADKADEIKGTESTGKTVQLS
ncbi:ftsZ [Methanoculleus sp. CAG:1088]|nr:ftsZ [Methanoculleus sp. CAG:1088]